MARMEEQLDQFVDQLADRMNDIMNPRRRRDRNSRGSEGEESENLFFDGDGSSFDEQPDRPRRNQREVNRSWESGMRVNIPEFDGNTLNPKGFIDWLVAVEEVFDVPENKRVSLIATKLRGTKFVKDYTTEFYQLIARNDIQETDDQLVSRYIGGLRVQIMDSVNMFDPTKVGGGNTGPIPKGVGSSGLKCFNCGEPGHRQSECKKAGKRHLFVDDEWEDNGLADDDYEGAPVFDDGYEEAPIFDDDQFEEESMPVYDTDIEDVTEKEEGFVGKG
ncbi:reverse transcriptase domain-containing protein, partial [Tanacetum coccineum]